MIDHIGLFVDLTALHPRPLAEHIVDFSPECFGAVDHDQDAPFGVEAAVHERHEGQLRQSPSSDLSCCFRGPRLGSDQVSVGVVLQSGGFVVVVE